jgi:TolB-like protein/DNA-binding winged helix-turn-helix (wHTH) protein/cytochrome c-type biogenesis protein CcmH/NrfG
MTTHDFDSPAQMEAKRRRFDRYVLDLDRGSLLLDGNEIALRPKTFAVLRYLIENCGRLVSEDELFAAVWPNIAVTDDALVQSIGELRRALGDDGARLIKTIPRRGYRFESDVSVVDLVGQPSADALSVAAASPDAARPLKSGARIGLFAAFGIAVLLAGMLWAGIATEWKFFNAPGYANRSTPNSVEINAKPAIAILPFASQDNDPARDYFADGLTQDIINALGRFSELTVMSWNAAFPYKGKAASPGEIARNLAVRYQVEGSVLRTADRVRVTAQLVDVDGRVLWSARFDEALADLFALQDKITIHIAGVLAIRVTEIEQRRVLAKPTESLEAYEYVLRARPALQRPARADLVEARVLLRRAIALDPNYAAAYAALAETYHVAAVMGWAESPADTLSRAEELANKALSINDSEVRAHIILGRVHIFHQRYEQAKAEMDRAIAINPNDALGLAGRGNLLMWLGETDAAIEVLELARRIDPELNTVDRNALSLAYYLKGRYAAAIEEAKLNLRRTTGANFSRIVLAAAYAEHSQADDAARVVAEVRRLDPTFDPREFGSKFLRPADLEHLRDGLRKAGLDAAPPRGTDR